MFCAVFRYRISNELDSEIELSSQTLKHIAKCRQCRAYYEKLKRMENAMSCIPGTDIGYYNIDRLNESISSHIDEKASQSFSINIKYPTVRYNNKFAMAAVMFIAAMLSFSVYVNLNKTNNNSTIQTDNTLAQTATQTHSNYTNSTDNNNMPTISNPQMAVLYQLTTFPYRQITSLPYQEQYKESREIYEKTQEITEKSSKVINSVLKKSYLVFSLL